MPKNPSSQRGQVKGRCTYDFPEAKSLVVEMESNRLEPGEPRTAIQFPTKRYITKGGLATTPRKKRASLTYTSC